MMVRRKSAYKQIQALIMTILKSGRSYSVILSDIIVATSTIAESLQKWSKSVNYTDKFAKRGCVSKKYSRDKRVFALEIENK